MNSAQDKLDRFNHEPGETSNTEVQRLVASIFYCFNLVILQCIIPLILITSFVCLYKNAAGISWFTFHPSDTNQTSSINSYGPIAFDYDQFDLFSASSNIDSSESMIKFWSSKFIQLRSIFGQFVDHFGLRLSIVARTILGFLTWWILASCLLTNLIGMAYHRFALD